MRRIEYIAVHCTAGRQTQTVADLLAEFRRKGWKNPDAKSMDTKIN